MPHTQTAKGARTRERILDAATDLFHERGINATTLGDVLRASGAGKGQFYRHFTGREDLVEQVLGRLAVSVCDLNEPIESWDDLHRWMTGFAQRQHAMGYTRGCPVGMAALSLNPDQERPRDTVRGMFDHMRDGIARFLRSEQRAGRLDPGSDPRALADFAVAAVQGAMILGLVERRPRSVRAVVAEAYRHIASCATGARSVATRM